MIFPSTKQPSCTLPGILSAAPLQRDIIIIIAMELCLTSLKIMLRRSALFAELLSMYVSHYNLLMRDEAVRPSMHRKKS